MTRTPLLPIVRLFPKPFSGLKRVGIRTWRATNSDPQFLFRLRRKPQFLLLLLDGLGDALDPMIYFDFGAGFGESESRPLQPARRVACVIALNRFPDLHRIRFDPTTQPLRFRFAAIGFHRLWQARRFVRTINVLSRGREDRAAFSIELVDGKEFGAVDVTDGASVKLSSLQSHFQHVIALAEQRAAPPVRGDAAAPLVSLIVPTFNANPHHLNDLVASVRGQHDAACELILSDDGSANEDSRRWLDSKSSERDITIIRSQINSGIAAATNAGLAIARGSWVALVDHDDALAPHALKLFADAVHQRPDALFFYTDEVVTDSELRPTQYFVKPAFDPVLLSGVNYINHLSFFRRDRLLRAEGLDSGFQGSQDYDLLLRYLDGLSPREIVHIPYPAYLWRRHDVAHSLTSKSAAVASARRALARFHQRQAVEVTVEPALIADLHRVRFSRGGAAWPLVSVIIPNREAFQLIATLLESLAGSTDYPAIEVIIVDNGSTDARVLALYERYKTHFASFQVLIRQEEFNFSRAVNRGIGTASGAYVLLLNNDIEIIEPGWLKEMVSCFAYPNTGIVGARLLFPNRRIQHVGVIVGLGGLAGHWFVHEPESLPGPMGRLAVRQSLTAVTAAAMLISRACLDQTGPFDEEAFAIAYNDVDFCLRAGARGYRTVWTPFATLIHHESASRGSDERPDTIDRFHREQERLRARHGTMTFEDRAFSPWYTRDRSNPIYRFRTDLPDYR
ncbi:MAG TPA: glycosyltransferase family 2 protein [Pseudolabrys sp.]